MTDAPTNEMDDTVARATWLRVAEAPYLTDTHYVTPPPRCELEEALRCSISRREWFNVNELLQKLKSQKAYISGGVLDLAIRVQIDDPNDADPDQQQSTPSHGMGLADLPPPYPSTFGGGYQQGAAARRFLLQGGDHLNTTSDSDDERHLMPKMMRGGGGRGGWNGTQHHHSHPPGAGLGNTWSSGQGSSMPIAPSSRAHDYFSGGGGGGRGSIMVPASSLPAASPPPILRFDHEGSQGDWRAGDVRDVLTHQPNHPSFRQPISNANAPMMMGMSVDGRLSSSSPAASLSCSPQMSLQSFLSNDRPTAHALVKRLLEYPYYDTKYCGPVAVAVQLGELSCVRVLLKDMRFDPNTGCPVRLAVTLGRIECFEELLSSPRISPNHGAPLHHAVVEGKLWAVTTLLGMSRTQVNRYATGTSSTPLIAAIRAVMAQRVQYPQQQDPTPHEWTSPNASIHTNSSIPMTTNVMNRYAPLPSAGTPMVLGSGGGSGGSVVPSTASNAEAIVRAIVQCSRIDVNKGFCITPLQLATQAGDAELVRQILCKPNVAPNRTVGAWPTPLEIAIEEDDTEMVRILLTDPRIYVTEEMVNQLEVSNNLPILQLIANLSNDVRIGHVWTLRYMTVLGCALVLWAMAVCNIIFVTAASKEGEQALAGCVLAVQVIGCVCAVGGLLRPRRVTQGSAIPWYLSAIPFAPVAESAAAGHVVQWMFADHYDVFSRQKLFELFTFVSNVRGLAVLLPQSVVYVVAILNGPRTLRGYSGAGFIISLLSLLLCFAVRAQRISNAGAYPPEPSKALPRRRLPSSSSAVQVPTVLREIAV